MAHVTFIHGIQNKHTPDVTLQQWQRALASDDGLDLGTRGVTSSLVYWADVLYSKPLEEAPELEATAQDVTAAGIDDDTDWLGALPPEEQAFAGALAGRFGMDATLAAPTADAEPTASVEGFERFPLPDFAVRAFMNAFLRDVHHYLFNTTFSPRPDVTYQVRDEIRRRFVERVKQDAEDNQSGPHVVVAHSLGSVIAYDCLKQVVGCPPIDALVTAGSPLGIDEVQDQLKPGWSRQDGYPRERLRNGWDNVYDGLDPVALDPELLNDYRDNGRGVVVDLSQNNGGWWRHDMKRYLRGEELRSTLKGRLGL